MLIDLFKKAVVYIKQIQDIGLFGVMSNKDIFFVFTGSPLYYVMLPMIGMLMTLLALVNGYELLTARNKNLDKWFGFIVSVICAALSSISLYGAVIASILGVSFAIGPWFFLSSVAVAFAHQVATFGLNVYRVFESSIGSTQFNHHMQTVVNTAFNLALITAVAGSVVFVMLTPIAPAVGSFFALTAVVLTAANILWRLIPDNFKNTLKQQFGLWKPEQEVVLESDFIQSKDSVLVAAQESTYYRIFTKIDHSAQVKQNNISSGLDYLRTTIQNKIDLFDAKSLPHSEKNSQKRALLADTLLAIDTDLSSFSKKQLLEKYPLAFQSFWAEKGDVEEIVDAADLIQAKKNDNVAEENDTTAYEAQGLSLGYL